MAGADTQGSEISSTFPLGRQFIPLTNNTAQKLVRHHMIVIIQRSWVPGSRKRKKYRESEGERERRKMWDSQQTPENLWSFINRLQQQQLNHVEANMLHCFFFLMCLPFTPPPCSPPMYVTPNTLLHPGSASPSVWLPYLLSNVVRNAANSLWVTALRLDVHLAAWQEGQNVKQRKKYGSFMPNRRAG